MCIIPTLNISQIIKGLCARQLHCDVIVCMHFRDAARHAACTFPPNKQKQWIAYGHNIWEKFSHLVCYWDRIYPTLVIDNHISHSPRSCEMESLWLGWDVLSQMHTGCEPINRTCCLIILSFAQYNMFKLWTHVRALAKSKISTILLEYL
jgi:hypothetical protein